MGFWNKLGKIALQAAPYVAAPFTGGASLMATGATQKLGQKWAEHDAKKAIEKGLAPSKFDKYLGMASGAAGLGTSLFNPSGLMGGAAKATGGVAKGLSGWQNTLGKIGQGASIAMGAAPRGQGTESIVGGVPGNMVGGWQGALATGLGGLLRDSKSADTPSSSQNSAPVGSNLAVPRASGGLAAAISRGRDTAMLNQPFRQGYEIRTQGPDDTVISNRTTPIYPNIPPPQVVSPPVDESAPTPIQNRFGDELTPPRRARRRVPVEEEY